MEGWGNPKMGSNLSNKGGSSEHPMDLKGNTRRQFDIFLERFGYELKHSDKVILEKGSYDLKTRDLVLLLPGNWLNDMTINYFGLLLASDEFKEAINLKGFKNNLFNKNFLILNTFVGINLIYLEEMYFEYLKFKLREEDSKTFESQDSDDEDLGPQPSLKGSKQGVNFRESAKNNYLK